jgi:hypothetical protein
VCTPAINILEDMGVLKELMDNNEAHFADSGVHCLAVAADTRCFWLRALQKGYPERPERGTIRQ